MNTQEFERLAANRPGLILAAIATGCPEIEAEDAVADALLQLWERRDQVDNPKGWLERAVKSHAIDRARRASRFVHLHGREPLDVERSGKARGRKAPRSLWDADEDSRCQQTGRVLMSGGQLTQDGARAIAERGWLTPAATG